MPIRTLWDWTGRLCCSSGVEGEARVRLSGQPYGDDQAKRAPPRGACRWALFIAARTTKLIATSSPALLLLAASLLLCPALFLGPVGAASSWTISTQAQWQSGTLNHTVAPGNYIELQSSQWELFASNAVFAPNSIDMVSSTDGWLVAWQGKIMRYNGTSWSEVTSPVTAELRSVHMLSSADGWAVGDSGTIIKWNGTSWATTTSPTSNVLASVHMLSSTDGWAVGWSGTILRWNGTSWTTTTSPTTYNLESVFMLSSTQGWAVGSDIMGNGIILKYNGSNWAVEANTSSLRSVYMVSASDGWAVGNGGLILRYNGTTWSPVASPTTNSFFQVKMLSATDGWAVATGGTICKYDGTSWSAVPSPISWTITSVDMVSASEGWAISSDTNDGLILKYPGANWQAQTNPGGTWHYSVDMLTPTDGWAVGGSGTIIKRNGTSWATATSPTSNMLFSVSMLNSSEGWAVGDLGTIVKYDGSSWATATSPTGNSLYSVDTVSSSDGWAVGASGTIIRWNGTSWAATTSPTTSSLRSIDMLSSSEGWAVGSGGTVIRHNGVSWSTVPTCTSSILRSISMLSSNEGWAVGEAGTIIRWNGTNWSTVSSPTGNNLWSIKMLSSREGWAVGGNQTILRWDGASWTAMTSPASGHLYSVDFVSSGEGWAVGQNITGTAGTIIRYANQRLSSGTATHTFDAGQVADWLSHSYDATQRSAQVYPGTADASSNAEVSTGNSAWTEMKSLALDLTGVTHLKVKTSLRANNNGKIVDLRVTVAGVPILTRTTDQGSYQEYEDIARIPTNGAGTQVKLWLKRTSGGATAFNQRFELYKGSPQTVTSTTFRWATSDDGNSWSTWASDVAALADSRYIRQQCTLSTSDTALSPRLFSTTVTWDPAGAAPSDPTSLNQYEANGTTPIAVGANTQSGCDTNIYLKFSMSSPNASDTLTPKVEVRPVGVAFTGTPTHTGSPASYPGAPVIASIAVSGLTPGTSYHWRAWVTGQWGDSSFVSFGGNPEDQADFRVATNLAAQISTPLDGATVQGVVTISGIAAGTNFASYILEWGKGGNPKTWTTIEASTTPVVGLTLGVWDASSERGAHVVRLRVFDGVGGERTVRVSVVVVKPTPAGDEAGRRATAWGNQRKLVRTSDDTLCAFYEDNTGGVTWKKSTNGGLTWSIVAALSTTADEVTVVRASNDDLHIAYHSTGGANIGVVYRKATRSGGGWVLSSEVPVRSGSDAMRNPGIVLDQNSLPHVVWGKGTTAVPSEAAIFWRRATGDPTLLANWAAETTISAAPAVDMGNPNGNPYVGAAIVRNPSTHDLYAVFNVSSGGTGKVCINRALYSAGTWTWGSYYEGGTTASDRPPSAVFVGNSIRVLARPGSDVVYMNIPATNWNDASGWNTCTLSSSAFLRSSASITYDSLNNLYAFFCTTAQSNGAIGYRVLPTGASHTVWRTIQHMTSDNTGHNHPNTKEGSSSSVIEWLWTNKTATPYTVLYDRIGLVPAAPSSMVQYASNHTSVIATGASTGDGVITNLYLDFAMASNNAQDTLTPLAEVRPVGVAFTGAATHMGFSESFTGAPVTGSVAVTGLSVDTNYHWQAWVLGDFGESEKVSFGSNEETATDFRVVSFVSLSLDSSYNRDGTPGGGSVAFGDVGPGSAYVVHTDGDKHAVQLTTWSNATWSLSATATALSDGLGHTIPVAQLAWRPHATADPWTTFQEAPQAILTGQPPTTGTTVRHDYQLTVTWDDVPGTYSTHVTYTAASP